MHIPADDGKRAPMPPNETARTAVPNEAGAPCEARLLAWVGLHCLGVRGTQIHEIIEHGGPQACMALGIAGLRPWVSARQWERLRADSGAWARAMRWMERVADFRRQGGHVLTPELPFWRARVRHRSGLPLSMYVRGELHWLAARPCVGMVGSRRPTSRAAHRAHRFAHTFTAAGAVVCSGGAWGIDLAAHRGAIAAGGATIAVLGEPLAAAGDERPDRVKELGAQAVTLIPHGPWVPMNRRLFVSRNRWIAALSDALVVLEGAAQSGTAHTARAAAQFGVPIYAVPGDPDAPNSQTPNRLIAEGVAQPLLRAETLLARLGLLGGAPSDCDEPHGGPRQRQSAPMVPPVSGPGPTLHAVSATASPEAPWSKVLKPGTPMTIEGLARRLGLSVPETLRLAMSLELEGRVRREGTWLHPV